MGDLVSKSAVLAQFKKFQSYDPEYQGRGYACNFLNDAREPSAEWSCVEDIVENAPTVDAIPVEWLCRKIRKEGEQGNVLKAECLKELIWEFHQEE